MESQSLTLARQFLHKEVEVTIDRPLGSLHPRHGFLYEVNYGFIAGVKAPDGEDLDAYYLGTDKPLAIAKGICVAIVHRKNDDDDKLVVVPSRVSISDEEILKLVHFQEQFFDSVVLRK